MANMSYCRFENTSSDLADCVAVLEEALDEGKTLKQFQASLGGEHERAAFRRMLRLCEEFTQMVEDMVTGEEIPEVDDAE